MAADCPQYDPQNVSDEFLTIQQDILLAAQKSECVTEEWAAATLVLTPFGGGGGAAAGATSSGCEQIVGNFSSSIQEVMNISCTLTQNSTTITDNTVINNQQEFKYVINAGDNATINASNIGGSIEVEYKEVRRYTLTSEQAVQYVTDIGTAVQNDLNAFADSSSSGIGGDGAQIAINSVSNYVSTINSESSIVTNFVDIINTLHISNGQVIDFTIACGDDCDVNISNQTLDAQVLVDRQIQMAIGSLTTNVFESIVQTDIMNEMTTDATLVNEGVDPTDVISGIGDIFGGIIATILAPVLLLGGGALLISIGAKKLVPKTMKSVLIAFAVMTVVLCILFFLGENYVAGGICSLILIGCITYFVIYQHKLKQLKSDQNNNYEPTIKATEIANNIE